MSRYVDMSAGAEHTHVVDARVLRSRVVPGTVTIPDDAELVEVELRFMSNGGLCHGRIAGHTAICWPVTAVLHGWVITGDPNERERAGLPPRKVAR